MCILRRKRDAVRHREFRIPYFVNTNSFLLLREINYYFNVLLIQNITKFEGFMELNLILSEKTLNGVLYDSITNNVFGLSSK